MISFQEEKEEEEKEKDHCSFFLSSIILDFQRSFRVLIYSSLFIETFTFEIISKDFKRYYFKATTIEES